jgi:hypothetical protein
MRACASRNSWSTWRELLSCARDAIKVDGGTRIEQHLYRLHLCVGTGAADGLRQSRIVFLRVDPVYRRTMGDQVAHHVDLAEPGHDPEWARPAPIACGDIHAVRDQQIKQLLRGGVGQVLVRSPRLVKLGVRERRGLPPERVAKRRALAEKPLHGRQPGPGIHVPVTGDYQIDVLYPPVLITGNSKRGTLVLQALHDVQPGCHFRL